MLETLIPPINSLLDLIGHNTATADDEDAAVDGEKLPQPGQRRSRFYGITIKDLLEAGYLKPNDLLVSTNGRWPATARVTKDGHIEQGGTSYETPSPAASAAAHGGAMAGWDFWAIQDKTGTVALKTLRARYLRDRSEITNQH